MRKRHYIIALITFFLAPIMFIHCNTPTQKTDKTKSDVQEATQDVTQPQADVKQQKPKPVTAEEWKAFKSSSETKIKENDSRITSLKGSMVKDSINQKKITEFEQKNNILRSKLIAYENDQIDWEAFKRAFSHDLDELANSLNEINNQDKK